jgi:hypothetical protein
MADRTVETLGSVSSDSERGRASESGRRGALKREGGGEGPEKISQERGKGEEERSRRARSDREED